MDSQFAQLEQKIDKVVAFCRALREENRALRGRVVELEGEKQALAEKIDTTRVRLEALMARLPEA